MAIRRAPANGKPKLSPILEAQLMVTAAKMKLTGSEALTDAATRWIKWAEHAALRQNYKAHQADYDAGRSDVSPDPVAYGLPPDFGAPRP